MAKITHYDVGDLWTPQATFTVSGTNTDPTTLVVRQQDADGVETVLFTGSTAALTGSSTPVAKTATGIYKLNPGISLTAAGYWFVKFEGTAGVVATEQQQAIVDPDEFTANAGLSTQALVGLAETKDWLQQQNVTTDNDLELVRVINDVSDLFTEEASREFKVVGTNPQVRLFWADQLAQQGFVEVGDLASYTQIRIISYDWVSVVGTVDLTTVVAEPLVRRTWEPITRLRINLRLQRVWRGERIEVTGNFGFPSVPGRVRQAVMDTVASVVDRDVENYRQDQAPQGAEGASNVIVLGSGPTITTLPPRALAVARSFNKGLVG